MGFAHSLSDCNFAIMLIYCIFRPAFPELEFVLKSPGRLVTTLIASLNAKRWRSWGPESCISNKLPGGPDAAGPRATH